MLKSISSENSPKNRPGLDPHSAPRPPVVVEDASLWSTFRLRGRPVKLSPPEVRNQVLHYIRDTGPCVNLKLLRTQFPNVRRCELNDLLTRYRRVLRRLHRQPQCRLDWRRPGTVWAMDFVDAPQLVDGRFPQLLAILDVASCQTLAWLPVESATAENVERILTELFQQQGPPLVLKADNGSALLAESLKQFLEAHEVTPLYSPPHCPRYNGACERNNGVLKQQTHHAAAQAGHVDWWAATDAEAARVTLNTRRRPWGHLGPTPEERWTLSRLPITDAERAAFRALVASERQVVRSTCEHPADALLPHGQQAAVDRLAVTRALTNQGLLIIRRRLVTLPLHRLTAAKIL